MRSLNPVPCAPSSFAAPGGLPYGATVPVPRLGSTPRSAGIQALLPEAHPAGGQMAGGV